MIQVNRIYLIFNRLVTKKFLVDTSVKTYLLNYCLPLYNFCSHLNTQSFGNTLNITLEPKL